MTDLQVSKISPALVNEIFMDCLFKPGEATDDHVLVEGVQLIVGFHPGRLAKNKPAICELLQELPDSFKKNGGGGMSFLQACEDKHGNQWTGLHQRMEQLIMLGVGVGHVTCLMPPEMWSSLPGGMPYYSVS